MLKTNKLYGLHISVPEDSSNIFVAPGMIQIGTSLITYQGDKLSFPQVVTICGDTSNKYKNSLLYVTDTTTGSVQSSAASTMVKLTVPSVPSGTYPVGLFTFYSPDGSNAQMVTFSNINK